jgi:uracil-DNA glycosylase
VTLFDEHGAPGQPPLPDERTIEALRRAAAGCRACPLWETGTQTVFGDGPERAEVVMVGEQPGDKEDLEGEPFVGPAGRVLDRALREVGIDRDLVYVTNAVKHFKWVPRGKRRIHQAPNAAEMAACRPWLLAELEAVRPKVLVALGATAAKSLYGPKFRITQQRGQFVDCDLAPLATATVHPSSILRAPDADRDAAMAAFVADMGTVAEALSR